MSFKVCGYRDSLEDMVMHDRFCANHDPIPYGDWYKLTVNWMNKETDQNPYVGEWPTHEETLIWLNNNQDKK